MQDSLGGLREIKDQMREMSRRLNGMLSCSYCKVLTFQITDEDDTKFLQWLSDIRYADDHENNSKDILQDTGGWLLKDTDFRRWMEGGSVLWLRGIR
jgi:hypothetical protein